METEDWTNKEQEQDTLIDFVGFHLFSSVFAPFCLFLSFEPSLPGASMFVVSAVFTCGGHLVPLRQGQIKRVAHLH